jgi:NAD(P)-dependent dehydrogenase (short-subunit alcohol dehydrogenase family)
VDVAGKTALVTGAGAGIGRVIALRLAREGAAVVVNDVDGETGAQTSADIAAAGGRASFAHDDVTHDDELEAAVDHAEREFGRFDILVNNAGGSPDPVFPEAPLEHWSRSFDLNLRSAMVAIHFAVPAMLRSGGGAIVNIASSAGLGTAPHPAPEYAVAKAGIVRLTACLAPLAERGIRVNCVCPHTVGTPAVRQRIAELQADGQELPGPLQDELLEPEEVAATVVDFIADESAAGRVLVLVGGQEPHLLAEECERR